jgi:hypothetical protein
MSLPHQTTFLQDSQNTLPSELVPIALPQTGTINLVQSLQARALGEQLKAFTSQPSIRHEDQTLSQPRATDNIHIITTTDDMVPKARITSLTLFLEIQLFKAGHSANFDANMHRYVPADYLLFTLGQVGRSRPHLKTMVALIESYLAHACFQALVTAHIQPLDSFPEHQNQYCRVRLAIATYTSSTILLRNNQNLPVDEFRLLSWRHVDNDFLLTVESLQPGKIQKPVREERVSAASIYFQSVDENVILSSFKVELKLIRQLHQNIGHSQGSQTADNQGQKQPVSNEYLNLNIMLNFLKLELQRPEAYSGLERAFSSSSSDAGVKRRHKNRYRLRKRKFHGSLRKQPYQDDVAGDGELTDAGGDTEPLET